MDVKYNYQELLDTFIHYNTTRELRSTFGNIVHPYKNGETVLIIGSGVDTKTFKIKIRDNTLSLNCWFDILENNMLIAKLAISKPGKYVGALTGRSQNCHYCYTCIRDCNFDLSLCSICFEKHKTLLYGMINIKLFKSFNKWAGSDKFIRSFYTIDSESLNIFTEFDECYEKISIELSVEYWSVFDG